MGWDYKGKIMLSIYELEQLVGYDDLLYFNKKALDKPEGVVYILPRPRSKVNEGGPGHQRVGKVADSTGGDGRRKGK